MKKIDTIVVAPHFYTMEGAGCRRRQNLEGGQPA